jgi:hypothetical protein
MLSRIPNGATERAGVARFGADWVRDLLDAFCICGTGTLACDLFQTSNVVDRRLGPNQARFWLDWVEKPSPAMPLHLWHRHSCLCAFSDTCAAQHRGRQHTRFSRAGWGPPKRNPERSRGSPSYPEDFHRTKTTSGSSTPALSLKKPMPLHLWHTPACDPIDTRVAQPPSAVAFSKFVEPQAGPQSSPVLACIPNQGILFEGAVPQPSLGAHAASVELPNSASLRLAAPGFFGYAVACAPAALMN